MSELSPEQKRNIQAWITNLTNGTYIQGQGRLRHNGTFCCLGVACDTYLQREGRGHWSNKGFVLNNKTDDDGLPRSVHKYFGVDTLFESKLISLNDGGASFKKIASTIKRFMEKGSV